MQFTTVTLIMKKVPKQDEQVFKNVAQWLLYREQKLILRHLLSLF